MRTEEIIGVLAFLSLVFIPALALTARFAMKPIVESIVKLREAFNLSAESEAVREAYNEEVKDHVVHDHPAHAAEVVNTEMRELPH